MILKCHWSLVKEVILMRETSSVGPGSEDAWRARKAPERVQALWPGVQDRERGVMRVCLPGSAPRTE